MNTPTEILVITNGKAVAVPADKWPKEPYGIDACGKFEKQCTRISEECECFVFNRQKREAIAQGAVVEYDVTQPDSYKSNHALAKIVPCDFDAPATLKDGAYPIDPAKFVVEKEYQVWIVNGFTTVYEHEYKDYKQNGLETRQIATIKPKAEDNSAHGYTEGSEYKMPTDFSKVYVDPAPAPTRKLAMDSVIYLTKLTERGRDGCTWGDTEFDSVSFAAGWNAALEMINTETQDLKAKEIENLTHTSFEFYYDMSNKMKVDFNKISENRDNAKEFITKTYNQ